VAKRYQGISIDRTHVKDIKYNLKTKIWLKKKIIHIERWSILLIKSRQQTPQVCAKKAEVSF
jgi:hypothetical protein